MRPDALTRVVVLLLRSRPFRGLLVVSLLAATVTLATSTSMAALRLSLEQSNTAYFGATQAMLQPDRRPMARPGQQIPDAPLVAAVGDQVQVVREAWTRVSLRDASDGFTEISYIELAMPSPPLEGTLELVEGRWPQAPGECAATVLIAVLPAAALAVAGPVLAVALLARVYPEAFDLPGVPWWALAAFLAGVVGDCWLATGFALRSLHRRERPVTI